jgi:hypothetical protein
MFGELARRIRRAGLGVTIEELWDIVWLAERLPTGEGRPLSSGGDDEGEAGRREEDEKRAKETSGRQDADGQTELDRRGASSNTDGSGTTNLYSAKQAGTIRASTLRVPGAAATEYPEDLRRALQPFARRVPSRWRSTLDEDETASRAADTGIWWPVYHPVRERWFDLILVIDSSPSVDLWAETLAEFQRLLRNQGEFRSVTTYRLHDAQDKQITLADGRRTYSISHLLDWDRPHIILLVPDATSARWRNGSAQKVLCELGSSASVSILQLLPRRAWRHTCIGEPELTLFTERAGDANARMKVLLPWWLDGTDEKVSLGVPVLGLDAATMRQWARTMTARGGAAIPGVLVAKPEAQKPEGAAVAKATQVVAEGPAARVACFRSMVSRSAYDLAVFLSVPHPLTVPVMRLVQRSMLPSTSTAELAEFFVGGLLQRMEDTPAADDGQPCEASYRFIDGMREELTKSLRYSEEGEINAQLRLVGRYLLDEGRESSSFDAYFPSPTGRYRLAEWTLPFASLSRQVLSESLVRTENEASESAKISQTTIEPREQPQTAVDVFVRIAYRGETLVFTVRSLLLRPERTYQSKVPHRDIPTRIRDLDGDSSELAAIGAAIVPQELSQVLADTRGNVVLVLDNEAEAHPWELIFWDHSITPPALLAMRRALVRQPLMGMPLEVPGRSGTQQPIALVIGDPLGSHPELPYAQMEARAVAQVLERVLSPEYQVMLYIRPAPEQLLQLLYSQPISVLFISGHGVQMELKGGGVRPGIPYGGNELLTAPALVAMQPPPEFIFLACCSLSMMVVELLQAGVAAVVTAQDLVDERSDFPTQFFTSLVNGATLGEAILKARRGTFAAGIVLRVCRGLSTDATETHATVS